MKSKQPLVKKADAFREIVRRLDDEPLDAKININFRPAQSRYIQKNFKTLPYEQQDSLFFL